MKWLDRLINGNDKGSINVTVGKPSKTGVIVSDKKVKQKRLSEFSDTDLLDEIMRRQYARYQRKVEINLSMQWKTDDGEKHKPTYNLTVMGYLKDFEI